MTIIFSCIPTDGSPPYIGADILLTNDYCPSEEFDFPSKRSQEAKVHGKVLNRSMQKLYVIHPCVAVAVCGYELTAKKFINRLSAEFKDKELDFETFIKEVDFCYGVSKSEEKGKSFGFTLIAYDESRNYFIHHHQGGNRKDFNKLGAFHYAGSGSKVFVDEVSTIDVFERNTDMLASDKLSIHRAISICFRLYAKECIADEGLSPLKDGIGGYYEFCYFCQKDRTFKYVEGIKVLLWPFHIRQAPHFGVEFGYHPREGEKEGEYDFRFWNNQYDDNGLIVEAYDNSSKTAYGHIVALKEYRSQRLTKSLYPVSEEYSGKFIFNCFYLKDFDHPYLMNSCFETREVTEADWISIDRTEIHNLFALKIGQNVFKEALHNVHQFFDSRWLIFDQHKISKFNPSQKRDYQKLGEMHEMAGNLRRSGQELMRKTGNSGLIRQARDMYKKARTLARKLNLRFFLADYTFCEGTCEEIMRNRRVAEVLFLKAEAEFADMMHMSRWTACLNSLGILYKNDYLELVENNQNAEAQLLYAKAKKYFEEAIKIQSIFEMSKSLVISKGNYSNLISL